MTMLVLRLHAVTSLPGFGVFKNQVILYTIIVYPGQFISYFAKQAIGTIVMYYLFDMQLLIFYRASQFHLIKPMKINNKLVSIAKTTK